MVININISQAYKANRAINDLMSVTKQIAAKKQFAVANPNIGELRLIGYRKGTTPEEEKQIWADVADTLLPYYDVLVTETEFNIFEKNTVIQHKAEEPEVKPTEEKEEPKEDENKGRGNIIKRTKRMLTKTFSRKPKKLSE